MTDELPQYYYYIDETGTIDVSEGVFILGCAVTSNLVSILEAIQGLNDELINSQFYSRHWKNLKKEGFHASTNHIDIYSRFVNLIPTLNFRSYFIVYDKTHPDYLSQLNKTGPSIMYDQALFKLLKDRLLKQKFSKHNIIIEQNLAKQTTTSFLNRVTEIDKIIAQIQDWMQTKGYLKSSEKIHFTVELATKENKCLSLIDYLLHILGQVYVGNIEKKYLPYMRENLRLIEPTIASIHDVFNNLYISPRKQSIDLTSLPIIWPGSG